MTNYMSCPVKACGVEFKTRRELSKHILKIHGKDEFVDFTKGLAEALNKDNYTVIKAGKVTVRGKPKFDTENWGNRLASARRRSTLPEAVPKLEREPVKRPEGKITYKPGSKPGTTVEWVEPPPRKLRPKPRRQAIYQHPGRGTHMAQEYLDALGVRVNPEARDSEDKRRKLKNEYGQFGVTPERYTMLLAFFNRTYYIMTEFSDAATAINNFINAIKDDPQVQQTGLIQYVDVAYNPVLKAFVKLNDELKKFKNVYLPALYDASEMLRQRREAHKDIDSAVQYYDAIRRKLQTIHIEFRTLLEQYENVYIGHLQPAIENFMQAITDFITAVDEHIHYAEFSGESVGKGVEDIQALTAKVDGIVNGMRGDYKKLSAIGDKLVGKKNKKKPTKERAIFTSGMQELELGMSKIDAFMEFARGHKDEFNVDKTILSGVVEVINAIKSKYTELEKISNSINAFEEDGVDVYGFLNGMYNIEAGIQKIDDIAHPAEITPAEPEEEEKGVKVTPDEESEEHNAEMKRGKYGNEMQAGVDEELHPDNEYDIKTEGKGAEKGVKITEEVDSADEEVPKVTKTPRANQIEFGVDEKLHPPNEYDLKTMVKTILEKGGGMELMKRIVLNDGSVIIECSKCGKMYTTRESFRKHLAGQCSPIQKDDTLIPYGETTPANNNTPDNKDIQQDTYVVSGKGIQSKQFDSLDDAANYVRDNFSNVDGSQISIEHKKPQFGGRMVDSTNTGFTGTTGQGNALQSP